MSRTALAGKDLAAALAVVVIWGLNFVAMKFALHDFTPFQLGAARYVFAALPLVLLVKFPRLHWKWVLLYGLGALAIGLAGCSGDNGPDDTSTPPDPVFPPITGTSWDVPWFHAATV